VNWGSSLKTKEVAMGNMICNLMFGITIVILFEITVY
jgi:hypothetical protein